MSGEDPPGLVTAFSPLRHPRVMEVALRSTTLGAVGAAGKVEGSGVLWKMMLGSLGSSTDKEADHEVSPLSELAVQVYNPVSDLFKSKEIYF